MLNCDFHSHSTFSDGLLTPTELINRAAASGITWLALTDHDEIAGLPEARAAANHSQSIKLINGVEFSSLWRTHTIHVVGLFFDPDHAALNDTIRKVHLGRNERAEQIAAKLAKLRIADALTGARRYVTNPDLISRSHFARFLEAEGHASSKQKAFDRYLSTGKPAYVPPPWETLENIVALLRAANGIAVLAHPGRYRLTHSARRELVKTFAEAGGEAIEIISPSHTPDDVRDFIDLARFFNLAASKGSDFHGDGESRFDLGKLPELPVSLTPVWALRPKEFGLS